jgi:hypothetical protein
VGARYDDALFGGSGRRPSDWAFALSVQQEIFPRASVEVAYHRRAFSMFTTGGTVTDNLAIAPSDVAEFSLTAPTDPRLPGGGGYAIDGLYNVSTNVFGQSNLLILSTEDVGDDSRVYDGVEVTVNVRSVGGLTFNGSITTSKVSDDWCEIRAAVPESYLLNPYCDIESPWQTGFGGLVTYTVPRIDVLLSGVYADRAAFGTNQITSLPATYTLTAADQADVAGQIGRALTGTAFQVNLLEPGRVYGDRVRQLDLAVKKVLRLGGQRLTLGVDMYNLMNNNVTLAYNGTFVPNTSGWNSPTSYMNPRVFRLNAEYAF